MKKIIDYISIIGAIIGFISLIFSFLNNISALVNYFYIHWVITPIISYIISSFFIIAYGYNQIIKIRETTKIITNNDYKKIKEKKIIKRITFIIIVLFVITIIIIAFRYFEIYNIFKNPKPPDVLFI